MEDRTKSMLKIIEEDGDSFARKAEMYFKKRPELIEIVEETYKAYKALADKYDHISSELHKANHTIAIAFPDQIHFDPQDEDDDNLPETVISIDPSKLRKPSSDIPQIPVMSKRKENLPALKKSRIMKSDSPRSKEKAEEEIGKLQKGILVLQTEKEFVKSSYEERITKYWDIEKQINEMQEEVFLLQDGYNANVVIEDDEARNLMAVTALKSCEDTLNSLQEEQKRSTEEVRVQTEIIKIGKEMLKSTDSHEEKKEMHSTAISSDKLEAESSSVEVKENVELSSETSMEELAEKINELVSKLISLEVTASSQTAQIKSMRLESDELHKNLQSFEKEKKTLVEDSNSLRERLKKAEELLETQNNEKHQQDEKRLADGFSAKAKDQVSISGSFEQSETSVQNIEAAVDYSKSGVEHKEILGLEKCGLDGKSMMEKEIPRDSGKTETNTEIPRDSGKTETTKKVLDRKRNLIAEEAERIKDSQLRDDSGGITSSNKDDTFQLGEKEISLDCLQSLANGLEGNDKNMLTEYTEILRNYKDAKKRLSEAEKENQEYHHEATEQIKKLERANVSKDEEIRSLQRTLRSLLANTNNNADADSCEVEGSSIQPRHERNLSSFESVYETFLAEEDMRQLDSNEHHTTSGIEEQFRRDIDTLFEENLEFWLRFSTSFQNIQKFQTDFEELQAETEKLRKKKKSEEGSSHNSSSGKASNPETQLAEKQLRELKTELQVWLEQHTMMQAELQTRFSSLGSKQEDISGALEQSLQEDGVQFAPYQAAKFHGELLNIEKENKKVADELQAGLDHVSGLKAEVEKTLSKLHKKFEMPESTKSNHQNLNHMTTKGRGVPLRSFLFTGKPKKKQSILGCVHPALQKHTHDLAHWRPK